MKEKSSFLIMLGLTEFTILGAIVFGLFVKGMPVVTVFFILMAIINVVNCIITFKNLKKKG